MTSTHHAHAFLMLAYETRALAEDLSDAPLKSELQAMALKLQEFAYEDELWREPAND